MCFSLMGSHWLYKLLRTDIIPSHKWPKQNKVIIFEIVLYIESHNTLSQQCFFFFLSCSISICLHIMFSNLGNICLPMCVSLLLCVSCAFDLAFCFSFHLFVLSHSGYMFVCLLVYNLSNFISAFIFLMYFCFYMEDIKERYVWVWS